MWGGLENPPHVCSAFDFVSGVADRFTHLAARFAESVLEIASVALIDPFILQLDVAAGPTNPALDLAGGLVDTPLNFVAIA